MTYYGVNFQEQLHSILVALTNDAMTEIGKLIEDGSAVLRLEIYHSQRENETLKRRLLDMENELKAFRQNVKKRAEPRKNAFATQYSPAEENDVEQSLGTRGLLPEPLIKKERLEGCETCPCADWRGNVLEAEGCVDVEWGLSLTQPLAVAMQPSAAGDLEHSNSAEEWPRSGEEQLGPAGEQPSPAEASLVSDHLPSDFCYATEGDAGSLPAQAELDLFPIAGAGVSDSQPFKEEGGLQPRWAEEVGSGLSPAHSGQFRDCSGNRVVQEEAHARPLVRPCSVRVEYLAVQSSPERTQDASEKEAVADSSHAPERPFVCTYCGKAFTWNISLKRHMQTHSRDRPFACPQCPRAFFSQHTLTAHLRNHKRVRQFHCATCGQGFFRKHHLNSHERTHTGERPYSCTYCGKDYKQLSNLISHQRSHTGEKPYGCTECGKCFHRLDNLKSHQRIHTRVRKYVCSFHNCGERFDQKYLLQSHQLSHVI